MSLIAINMMDVMKKTKRMGSEYSNGKAEMFIKEITLMMSDMATVKCAGLMDLLIKVTGNKEFNMAKEQ